MNDFITSAACAAGAVLTAGWAHSGTTGAVFWYLMMSICLLGLALLYAAQGILDAAEPAEARKRKIHKTPQHTVRNNRKAG